MKKSEILKGLTELIELSRLKNDLSNYAILVMARDIVEKSDIVVKVSDEDVWEKWFKELGLPGSLKAVDRAIDEGKIKASTEIEVGDESDDYVCCDGCKFGEHCQIDDGLDGYVFISPDMEAIEVASLLATECDFQIPFDLPHKRFEPSELREIAQYLITYADSSEARENAD